MQTFRVCVTEHNFRIVKIRANTSERAEEIARKRYEDGRLVMNDWNAEIDFRAECSLTN